MPQPIFPYSADPRYHHPGCRVVVADADLRITFRMWGERWCREEARHQAEQAKAVAKQLQIDRMHERQREADVYKVMNEAAARRTRT